VNLAVISLFKISLPQSNHFSHNFETFTMAKASYDSGRSLGYRQDLSGSVQYLGDLHGSNDSVDKAGVEQVRLIQPGQRIAPQERQPTYIPMGLEVLQDVDQFVIQQIYESEGITFK
jgi:hypothetical protein